MDNASKGGKRINNSYAVRNFPIFSELPEVVVEANYLHKHLIDLTIVSYSHSFELLIGNKSHVLSGKSLIKDISLFEDDFYQWNQLLKKADYDKSAQLTFSIHLEKWLGVQLLSVENQLYHFLFLDFSTTDKAPQPAANPKSHPDIQARKFFMSGFIEMSPDAISISDEHGKIIEWNHAQEEQTGIKAKDAKGQFIWEVYFQLATDHQKTERSFVQFKEMVKSMLHTGTSFDLDKIHEHVIYVNGEKKVLQNIVFPIKTCNGYQIASIGRNITELVIAREQLEHREHQYRLLTENIEEVIFSTDRNFNLLFISPSIEKLTGYSTYEIRKVKYDKFIHPEIFKTSKDLIKSGLNKENTSIQRLELQITSASGEKIWVEVYLRLAIDEDGEPKLIGTLRDIDQRKKVEMSLAASEKSLKMIIENSEDMILLQNPEGRYLYYQGPKQFNISTDQIINKLPEEVFSSQTAAEIRQEINKITESKKPLKNQQTLAWNGKIYWFDNIRYPVIREGEVVAISTISRNITSQKKFEFALMESEQKYHSIYNSAPIGIFRSDVNGKFLDMNHALALMLGYNTPAEAIESVQDLAKELYLKPSERKKLLDECHSKDGVAVYENEFYKRDGARYFGQLYLRKTTDEAGNTILEGVLEDITERKCAEIALKENEERFRKFFQDDILPKLLINPKSGKIVEANQAACSFYGYSMEEFDQMSVFAINKAKVPMVKNWMKQAQTSDQNLFQFNHTLADGSTKIVEVYSFGVSLKNRQFLLSTIHDITARKEAEHLLKESRRSLEELNATKDKFFNIIAHDLKTPFNQIVSLAQLVNDYYHKNQYSEMAEFVSYISKAANNGAELVKNLLDWSRTQTNKITIDKQKVSLQKLVEETIILLQPSADKKDIRIHTSCIGKSQVYGDKNMIKTVLRNLGTNAIKFSFEHSEIEFRINESKENVIVSVEDHGVGMQKEDMKKIFRIDQHHTTPGTARESGTGLGLILCKEFVEKNDGNLWVESKVGIGSKFIFTLPKKYYKY